MDQIGKFWASFIPKHVSNRIVLSVYRILTWIPISRKNREKNYHSNIERLSNANWDFWTQPSDFIENQREWNNIVFGAGSHHNMQYSGCEIMAVFNARKALTGIGSPESMAELIREFEEKGAALKGEFGVSPQAIEVYFKKHGFLTAATDKGDDKSLKRVDMQSQVLIATVYNDVNDITRQVHTVCITKEGNGYVLHNAYRKDQNGKYAASSPYALLSDAIAKISGYETKLLYLIGIAKAG